MVFCKRMPTGQNPVQPTTQAAKYCKSLSLLFLLPFLPRERLVASPNSTSMKSYNDKGTAGSWLGEMLGEMLDGLTTDVGAPVNVGWNVG